MEQQRTSTDNVNMNTAKARDLWRQFCSVCDVLLVDFGSKIDVKLYDQGQATAASMLAMDMVYFTLGEQSRETAVMIHEYLKTFQWPEELKEKYERLMRRSRLLRK